MQRAVPCEERAQLETPASSDTTRVHAGYGRGTDKWCTDGKVRQTVQVKAMTVAWRSLQKECQDPALTAAMQQAEAGVPPGFAWIQDDKDKKAMWLAQCRDIAGHLLLLLQRDPNFEHKSDMTAAQLLREEEERYRSLLKSMDQPPRWYQHKWKESNMLCLYMTVKHKCFAKPSADLMVNTADAPEVVTQKLEAVRAEQQQRPCSKPHHSCCRKVCSFRVYPMRSMMRTYSKALQIMLRSLNMDADIGGMHQATVMMRARIKKSWEQATAGGFIHKCATRGEHKEPWNAICQDAGQFFENVTPAMVRRYLDVTLAEAIRAGYTGAWLRTEQGAKLRGWLTDKKSMHKAGWQRLSLQDLRLVTHAVLESNKILTFQQVWQQQGTAIGGPMSGSACSVVLSRSEFIFAANCTATEAERDTTMRYADDLLMISACTCLKCLRNRIRATYPSPRGGNGNCARIRANFGSNREIEFLDLHLHFPTQSEVAAAIRTGRCPMPTIELAPLSKKNCVPTRISKKTPSLERLRELARARTCRVVQANMSQLDMKDTVKADVQWWTSKGYDAKTCMQCMGNNATHPRVADSY